MIITKSLFPMVFIIHSIMISVFVLPGLFKGGEGWEWIAPVLLDYPTTYIFYPLIELFAPNTGAWGLLSGHILFGGIWWIFLVWAVINLKLWFTRKEHG